MIRALLVALCLCLAFASPVEARSHHRHGPVRVCRLWGIAVTPGGDTGEPDLLHYVYRCTDGARYTIER